MKTRCRGCRTLIEYGNRYCEKCLSKIKANQKNRVKNERIEATTKSAAWQAIRRRIIQRDKSCVLCFLNGFVEYRNLQVHHIVKRVDNEDLIYEPKNLITLCRSCHERCEKMKVSDQKKLFKDYLNKDISFELL